MARLAKKSFQLVFFCRTLWVWGIHKICHIVHLLDSYLRKWLDSAVSNSPVIGQCCVQLSNGWSM